MNVLIRTDSSLLIGVGHISRTLELAERLRERGCVATFACRDLPGNMSQLVAEHDFPLRMLPSMVVEGTPLNEEADAELCAATIEELRPSWLVVDHYALGAKWESAGRGRRRHILVVDDLANRPHDCDLIVDQNLFFEGSKRYEALVPPECVKLVGPRYALLNPVYAERRIRSVRQRLKIANVLVYFGGGNTGLAILKSISALSTETNLSLRVDVVANPNMEQYDSVASACRSRPRTFLHRPRPSLVDLMQTADLAIGGGGVATWERMCVGLPTITVAMADNQRALAAQLADRGLTVSVGDVEEFTVKLLADAIDTMRAPGVLARMSNACQSVCDGRGAERVAEAMLAMT